MANSFRVLPEDDKRDLSRILVVSTDNGNFKEGAIRVEPPIQASTSFLTSISESSFGDVALTHLLTTDRATTLQFDARVHENSEGSTPEMAVRNCAEELLRRIIAQASETEFETYYSA